MTSEKAASLNPATALLPLGLTNTFLAEARKSAAEAVSLANECAASATVDESRCKLRLVAHRLRGAAGFFGFDAIHDQARALEEAALAGASATDLQAAARGLARSARIAVVRRS